MQRTQAGRAGVRGHQWPQTVPHWFRPSSSSRRPCLQPDPPAAALPNGLLLLGGWAQLIRVLAAEEGCELAMLLVEVLLPGGGGGAATQFWPPADAPEHEVPNSPQPAPFAPPWAPALHCAALVVVAEQE